MCNLLNFLKPGVISGNILNRIFNLIKKKNIALAAINCIDTNIINSVLESARIAKTVVIIQFSFSGSNFFIGKFNDNNNSNTINFSIKGSILAALYIHEASIFYNVSVILHTDHCIKNNLKWIDGLLEYNINYYNSYGKSLFTSHMIDLSSCDIKENLNISCYYLNKMSKLNIFLEMELGCTGGEEDGLDNSKISSDRLYTNPKDILYAYSKLIKINNNFLIAASFGNTHGVYKPGNINLNPKILFYSQILVKKFYNIKENNPLNFVFHGGSGTSNIIIKESISYGIVKINLDTNIQWNYWKGILNYYKNNKYYLKSQLGNPKGIYKPNKKFYDPRIWIDFGKKNIIKYLLNIYKQFNCNNLI